MKPAFVRLIEYSKFVLKSGGLASITSFNDFKCKFDKNVAAIYEKSTGSFCFRLVSKSISSLFSLSQRY